MTRRVLVTGVAGGVGRALAECFAADGWDVCGTDVDNPAGDLPLASFVAADLADVGAVRDAITKLAGRELDALINNAATQPAGTLKEPDPTAWDRAFAVNVRAAYLAISFAARPLQARRGSVVNIASVHALATSEGFLAYVASKGALVALTRAAALELAPDVRVNAVLPGALDTRLLHITSPQRRNLDALVARTPLKRIGAPSEAAQAALFLADHDRSSFVTGQTLVVDGGVLARLASE